MLHIERLTAQRIGTSVQEPLQDRLQLRAVTGNQHGAGLGIGLSHQPEHLAAVAIGKPHVDQDNLERGILEMLDNGLFVLGDADPIAALMQQVLQGQTEVGVIIDHQDQRSGQGLIHQGQQLGKVDRLGKDVTHPGRASRFRQARRRHTP